MMVGLYPIDYGHVSSVDEDPLLDLAIGVLVEDLLADVYAAQLGGVVELVVLGGTLQSEPGQLH